MTIFVAGGSGLVGSAIVRELKRLNQDVIGISSKDVDLLDRNKTLEFIKNLRKIFFCYAYSFIRNGNNQSVTFIPSSYRYFGLSTRVLNGIVNQIHQYLSNLRLIGVQHHGRLTPLFDLQGHLLLRRLLRDGGGLGRPPGRHPDGARSVGFRRCPGPRPR